MPGAADPHAGVPDKSANISRRHKVSNEVPHGRALAQPERVAYVRGGCCNRGPERTAFGAPESEAESGADEDPNDVGADVVGIHVAGGLEISDAVAYHKVSDAVSDPVPFG